jgi:hypothetical protein
MGKPRPHSGERFDAMARFWSCRHLCADSDSHSQVLLLRKANKYLRLKIPLLFAELDVAQIIDGLLGRYPKVNR